MKIEYKDFRFYVDGKPVERSKYSLLSFCENLGIDPMIFTNTGYILDLKVISRDGNLKLVPRILKAENMKPIKKKKSRKILGKLLERLAGYELTGIRINSEQSEMFTIYFEFGDWALMLWSKISTTSLIRLNPEEEMLSYLSMPEWNGSPWRPIRDNRFITEKTNCLVKSELTEALERHAFDFLMGLNVFSMAANLVGKSSEMKPVTDTKINADIFGTSESFSSWLRRWL